MSQMKMSYGFVLALGLVSLQACSDKSSSTDTELGDGVDVGSKLRLDSFSGEQEMLEQFRLAARTESEQVGVLTIAESATDSVTSGGGGASAPVTST